MARLLIRLVEEVLVYLRHWKYWFAVIRPEPFPGSISSATR